MNAPTMWKRKSSWVSFLVTLSLLQIPQVQGILPTGAIDVRLGNGTVYTMLVSQAFFGAIPEMQAKNNNYRMIQLPPDGNQLLCKNVTTTTSSAALNGTMLVPRGECTFELKAINAQRLGAKAVLIYGTLESRYSLNLTNQTDYQYTTADIVYPQKFYDYDCNKGRAEIPSAAIELEPLPYNANHNNPILSGSSDTNLCRKNSPNSLQNCPSQSCLLTGAKPTSDTMEACCAWDLHIWLYPDAAFKQDIVEIPVAYLTNEQARHIFDDLSSQQSVQIVMYSRYRAPYNPSSGLIWALGVAVAALAAYLSANDIRNFKNEVIKRRGRAISFALDAGINPNEPFSNDVRSRSRSPPLHRNIMEDGSMDSEVELPAPRQLNPMPATSNPPLDTLELNAGHALGFVVMASSGLLILFFFKIYNVVKVLYAIGCSKAVAQVLFQPLVSRVAKKFQVPDRVVCRTNTEEFGDLTLYEVISFALGYTLGITWLYVAFFFRHPESNLFFWVTQDVMGSCMCIMFLSIIKLNSIRVATFLLLVAFFYDIFFVFVTPLIFKGKSVMITVATSGGPPKADPGWCEKYPDDRNCQGGDPLPMLLTMPRIGDYQGGASLLGLGDIVLPGLLLSFAARLDEAKSLLGVFGGGNGSFHSYSCPEQKFCGGCRLCSGGYFLPLVIAYAVGLLMANMAVYLMRMGQPALLYLVPACLGTMVFMGWRRNELQGLWDGPKAVRSADSLIYGEIETDGHDPIPTEDGFESHPVPSAQEGSGDVPLLS